MFPDFTVRWSSAVGTSVQVAPEYALRYDQVGIWAMSSTADRRTPRTTEAALEGRTPERESHLSHCRKQLRCRFALEGFRRSLRSWR
jgi:hypothetical protein